MNTLEIFKAISERKGKDKINYLEEISHNTDLTLFKQVCELALDNTLSFHVTQLEEVLYNPLVDETPNYTIHDGFVFLLKLDNKGSASKSDKEHLCTIYTALADNERELLQMVLDRSLRCGLSTTSLRKVFGKDFLPDFPVMLCSSYDPKKIQKNIEFPAVSQMKSDGARCECVVKGGKITLRTRNGKEYLSLDALKAEIQYLDFEWGDYVLDGELIVTGASGEVLDRSTGNGILNKSIKGTISIIDAVKVKLMVWDVIPYDVFMGKTDSVGYLYRYKEVLYTVGEYKNLATKPMIDVIPSKIVASLEQAREHYKEMVDLGEEGTILKSVDGLWKSGRSKNQFKFKEEYPCELRVVSWNYGKKGSKYENCIGGLNCITECGEIEVTLGSGLSDEERGAKLGDEFLDYANSLVDKIIEGKYNTRIKSKTDKLETLFLPRAVEFRFDKDTANTRDDLINQELSVKMLTTG